jgi:chaperonin GroEL (HSP60 family)
MAKELLYGERPEKSLQKGIDQVANTVKITLGPRGGTWSWIRNSARRSLPTTA